MSEIHERTVKAKDLDYLDDIPDEDLVQGNFMRKEDFVNGMSVTMLGIARSNFENKYDLHIEMMGEEKIVTLTSKAVKELKQLYGKPSEWELQTVYIKANPGEWEVKGKRQKGYTLEVSRPE